MNNSRSFRVRLAGCLHSTASRGSPAVAGDDTREAGMTLGDAIGDSAPSSFWDRAFEPFTQDSYNYISNDRRADRNSSTAATNWSHSASPIGSETVIMPRRASQMPWASMSKKKSSFSFG